MVKERVLFILKTAILFFMAAFLLFEMTVNLSRQTLVCTAASGMPEAAVHDEPAKRDHLDPNTATLEELMTVPGIGPKTAQAIIDEREQNGDFFYPEDLMAVKGIGEKKMAAFKEYFVFPIEKDSR